MRKNYLLKVAGSNFVVKGMVHQAWMILGAIVIFFAALLPLRTIAQTTITWAGTANANAVVTPSNVGIVANSITKSSSLSTPSFTPNGYTTTNVSNAAGNRGWNESALSTTYLEFSVLLNCTDSYLINTISFTAKTNIGAITVPNSDLRYSFDNFATAGTILGGFAAGTTAAAKSYTTSITVLQGSNIRFRLYGSNIGANANSLSILNFALSGTVSPSSLIVTTSTTQNSCSASPTNIALTSSPTGASFSWSLGVSTNATGASAGSGNTIAQTLTSTGTPSTVQYIVTPTINGCTGTQATIANTINPAPSAFAVTGGGGYCSGGTGAVIGLAGSQTGVNYQLKNGAVNAGAAIAGTGGALTFTSQTAAGTYTVVATNSTTSCSSTMTGSKTISINPLPTITSLGVAAGVCFNAGAQSTFLAYSATTASPTSYSIAWTGIANQASTPFSFAAGGGSLTGIVIPAGTPAATYNGTLTMMNANGCLGTLALSVTISASPTLTTAASQASCSGSVNGINLTTSPSGSTFTWTIGTVVNVTGQANGSGSIINQLLNSTVKGSISSVQYIVTPTLNGCTGSTSTITDNVTSVNAGSLNAIRNGGKCGARIDGSPVICPSGAVATYLWYEESVGSPRTYTIVQDSVGEDLFPTGDATKFKYTRIAVCSSCIDSVKMNSPVSAYMGVSTTSTNVSCSGGANGSIMATINGGIAPFTYIWSNKTTAATYSNTDINSGLVPGTYSLQVKDSGNCSITLIPSVTIMQPASLPSATITGTPLTVCQGATSPVLTFTGSGGTPSYKYFYTIFDGTGTKADSTTVGSLINIAVPTGIAGTFTYNFSSVRDANSCTVSSALSPVTFTVNPAPVANAGPNQTICSGLTTTLGGSPSAIGGISPYIYLWTGSPISATNIANPTASPSITTTYTLKVTGANGCASTVSQATIIPSSTNSTKTWVGKGSSAGGTGADFNDLNNWSPAGVPSSCNDVVINVGVTAPSTTIILSGNVTLNSLALSDASPSAAGEAIVEVGANTLIVNANTAISESGSGIAAIGVANGTSAGNIDFKGNVTLNTGKAALYGNANSSFIFRGNLTLGTNAFFQPGGAINGTFDGTGPQTITWNNTATPAYFNNLVIGNTNSPTVNLASLNAALNNVTGNVTVNGSSVLNIGTSQLNRNSAGGTFTLNGTSVLKLSSISSPGGGVAVTGSNFPGGYTYTLSPTSTVEYAGASQTIYAAPTYGNLILSGSGSKAAGGSLSVVKDFSIAGTTNFALGTFTQIIGGNWAVYAPGGFTENSSTVEFSSNSAQSITTVGGEIFTNLRKSGTGTLTLNSDVVFNGTSSLNILAGTVDAGTFNLTGGGSTSLIMSGGTLKLAKTGIILPDFTIGLDYNLTGGTIELNGAGDQALRGLRSYRNLTFSTSGTKTLTSAPASITGTITINGAAVLDAGINSMGGAGTNLTMTGTSIYRTGGTGTKPDAQGTYILGAGTTVDFTNLVATQQNIRLSGINYYNINVSGTSVGNSSLVTGIPFQAGGTFTVKNGGTFNLANTAGFTGNTSTAISNVNNPTVVLEANSTVGYNGSGAQSITNVTGYQNLSLNGLAGVKTAPSGTLTAGGDLTLTGGNTFAHNGGTVLLNGTNQNFAGLSYNNLLLSGTGTKSLTGNGSIADSIQISSLVSPAATVLAIGNNFLNLRSTPAKTARVGAVPDAANITYGTGRFVVERFYPSRRAWRLITAPVTADAQRSIFSSWQMSGAVTSGEGMFITGKNPSVANGLDVSFFNNYSLKTWTGTALVGVADTKLEKISGTGGIQGTPDNKSYFAFVRGDRSSPNLMTPDFSNSTTLRDTGKIQIKTQVLSITGSFQGYDLIGNPFASQIDFNKIMANASGIDGNFFYVYDPYLNISDGGYLYFAFNGTSYELITPSVSTGGFTTNIQSGQAVYVKRSGTNATMTFNETDKTLSTNLGSFRPFSTNQSLRTNLFVVNADQTLAIADGVYARFDESFSNAVDIYDAFKFGNIKENLSLVRDSKALAVESRALIQDNDTLFLKLTNSTPKAYRFELIPGNFDPLLSAWLEDSYTTKKTFLNNTIATNYDFSITADSASAVSNRFRIVFKAAAAGPLPVTFTSVKATQQGANIAVTWDVQNQVNISSYEVEKSTDGRSFMKVHTTTATAGNGGSATYNWLDENPAEGLNYYRIKSITNATYAGYSKTVQVSIHNGEGMITIYPNPASGSSIGAEFKNLEAGIYYVRLINNLGQTLMSKAISHAGGTVLQKVKPVNKLVAGMYQLEVTAPDKKIISLNVIVK